MKRIMSILTKRVGFIKGGRRHEGVLRQVWKYLVSNVTYN